MGRLLLRLPNWLGDAILASEVVARAQVDPAGPPAVALRGWLAPLAEGWGEGLDVTPGLADAEAQPRRWASSRATVRRAGITRALVLTESWRGVGWARGAGLHPVTCFAGAGRRWLGARTVPRPPGHLLEQYAHLATAAGLPPAPRGAPFVVPDIWRAEARAALGPGDDQQRFLVLAPGASYGNAKRWPPAFFAAAAAELARDGWRVIVVGTAAEVAAGEAIAAAAGAAGTNLAGRTSLRALGGLCALAQIVLGNDSGVVHLAAAAGTPTVAVFGSTASDWTAPRTPGHHSVATPTPCAPCFQSTCRFGAPCLSAIAPPEVARAVRRAAGAAP